MREIDLLPTSSQQIQRHRALRGGLEKSWNGYLLSTVETVIGIHPKTGLLKFVNSLAAEQALRQQALKILLLIRNEIDIGIGVDLFVDDPVV